MRTKRMAALALVPAALLALSGCGLSAGAAAEVGGTKISTDDVDLLTKVQCRDLESAQSKAAGAKTSAVSLLRMQALNALIDAQLSDQFAKREHASYDKTVLRQQMTGVATFVDKLPSKDRKQVTSLIEQLNRAQLEMLSFGRQQLGHQGVSKPTDDEALNAAYKARSKFEKSVDVKIDPEYAPGKNRVAGTGDRSLSKPVSTFAKESASTEPRAGWADGLPPAQKCG